MDIVKERIHEDFIKLKENRESYFDTFYSNNYNLVYRICFSILKNKENSEDVAQTVFEKIYKLPDEKIASSYESSWLYTVAKNEAIQFLRKSKNDVSIDDSLFEVPDSTNHMNQIEENEEYKNLVKQLNKKQEQIVSLKVLSDFTFKEIGEILSMPTATVQWYYYKSIRFLRLAIGNMAMFVIALTTGIVFLNKEKKEKVNKAPIVKESTNSYDVNESENINKQETAGNTAKHIDQIIGNMESTNSIETDSVQVAREFNISKPALMFSVASVFLVITIVVSIICAKHRKKDKEKLINKKSI